MPRIGLHVLVVDDDPGLREALDAALASEYIVHTAATGDEACALLSVHPISAIILDAFLKHEHGLDLVEPFRALSPAPIALLTGHGSEKLAMSQKQYGGGMQRVCIARHCTPMRRDANPTQLTKSTVGATALSWRRCKQREVLLTPR